jgi:polyhydroxyalkanoate synthesis repressor PhaR
VGVRIIKKYATRRMYDVKDSSFVTLAKVADLIASGERIQVVDDRTDSDITATVLMQIVLEQQKSGQGLASAPELLRELVKKGASSALDFLAQPVFGPLGVVSLTEEKARKAVEKLVKIGKVSTDEGDNLLKGLLAKAGESRKTLEVFIGETLARMNMPTRIEFRKLKEEIEKLKEQIGALGASSRTDGSGL